MNSMEGRVAGDQPVSSFTFTGNWREYLPIALTNFLLTLATLGFYRFWAKARERRYLWSRTHFIDDAFEWTGTGKEMFVGFLIVMAAFIPAILVINILAQALIMRGQLIAGGVLIAVIYAGLFYLINVALFRALRYRLSRTWWHGIRGGSNDSGWRYGLSAIWRTLAGAAPLGLLIPWTMASLWNERWNAMSFGPHPFRADARFERLMGRWLLAYLGPILAGGLAAVLVASTVASSTSQGSPLEAVYTLMMSLVVAVAIFYVVFLFLGLCYYALFFRTVAGSTSVAGLEFGFTARTWDWFKLILGNIALVLVTLGVGALFISYRNYSFLVRHMEAYGLVDLDLLTQSRTKAPSDAEGLADAFDIGAF
ncbi:MAG TPA: YjgN family protein [Allosphingosinicella sp.]